jgi:hypothetical protein
MSENNQVDLSDLNALALTEFIKLIKNNEELDAKWKETILKLVENGIPEDLGDLEVILGGQEDVENQTS